MLHFLRIGSVVRATEKVIANSLKIVWVCEVIESAKSFNFQQQVDSFRFFIMIDEFWDDLVYQLVNLVHGLFSLNARLIILPNLSS